MTRNGPRLCPDCGRPGALHWPWCKRCPDPRPKDNPLDGTRLWDNS